jgi:hypothetical protein
VTDEPVPSALATLPDPWRMSDHYARHDAVKRLPAGPEQRAEALNALEACLAFLVDRANDTDLGLPERFHDHWFALARSFRSRMPTLADVSRVAIRRWLEEDVDTAIVFGSDWVTPPDDVVDKIALFWASAMAHRLADELTRWLRKAVRQNPDAPERARLLAMLKAAVPRLPSHRAIVGIAAIRDLGGAAEMDYLRQVEADPGVPEEVREEAGRARQIVERNAAG